MIEVSHLTKRYGGHTAVSNLTFNVEDGQIYGFLGPNGAGKSTTMNMMTGCLAATEGSVRINGFDIFEQPMKAKRCIGYLPEIPPLYTEMTPKEYLRFVGRAKGLSGDRLAGEIERVCRRTDIAAMQNRLIRHLSKGYRQRVGLAQAMLGDPAIIILDEPTVGLDPAQIIEIRQLIQELGKEHTVLLSSHILPEVQAVCGHILILSHGKLVASDTPQRLEQLFAGQATVSLTLRGGQSDVQAVLSGLENMQCTLEPESENTVHATVTARESDVDTDWLCERLFFAFADARLPILSMAGAKASLEDVFLELTRDDPTAGHSGQGEQAAPALDTAIHWEMEEASANGPSENGAPEEQQEGVAPGGAAAQPQASTKGGEEL